jgi:hypothetical protein
MRCEDVEFGLLALIEGELPPAQHTEILAHLHGCATCTAALSAYQDLLARMQVDPVPEPAPGFWEEFLLSLKYRIGREAGRHEPTSTAWLAGAGSWFTFRPRLIAGLAVAAVSILMVVRLPGLLPDRADRQIASISTEKVIGRDSENHGVAMAPRPGVGDRQSSEPLVVAGEIIEEPSILAAAIQRLRGIDEIADRLETAWMLRPEADPMDSLASLDEKERQILFDRMRNFRWSQS